MKFFKFLAVSIAALSMVACNPDNGKENDGPGFITQEYIKVYSDVSATGWETVGVWAWNLEDQSNYTGGTWPGEQLTETETIDGKTYYVWNAPKEIAGQTIGFIVNDFGANGKQTVDLNVTVKAEGSFVVLTEESADGKWLASVDGVDAEEPEQEPTPEVKLADHTWSIVGAFNDWGGSADIAMTVANGWAVATFDVADGGTELKVRADGSWDINYGFAGETLPTDGSEFPATYKAGNMVVAAGNYTLSFTINGQEGTFKLKKN